MFEVAAASAEESIAFRKLRHDVFNRKLGWGLDHFDGVEEDVYDQGPSWELVVKDAGVVVGGCRLMLCGVDWQPGASYMARDAVLGRLQGLPTNLLWGAPPTDNKTMELTRVIAPAGSLPLLMADAQCFGVTLGALHCLYISRSAMIRLGRTIGLHCTPVGPEFTVGCKKYVAMSTVLVPK